MLMLLDVEEDGKHCKYVDKIENCRGGGRGFWVELWQYFWQLEGDDWQFEDWLREVMAVLD
jgi:hypothetical protein